jgi:hypothetical protein
MPRQFFFAGTLFSFVFFSTFAVAQSAENKQSSSSSSQQNSSASSSQKTGSDPAAKPPEKKKPKKVWTNEEVGSLNGTVSVVGDPAAATAGGPSAGSRATAASGDAERYRRQLSPLRSDLAELDRQIREVKSRGAQGASYNHTSLDKLEDRRKSLQLKIDAVEEDARRHGIAPGDLR